MAEFDDLTERIPTGYEGQNVPDDLSIPSCGIEDVDRALFNLFDKKVKFAVTRNNSTVKVPVIFAVGERFAVVKKKKPIRDKQGVLILPLISIRRTSINQSKTMGGIGRGIGQDTGDLVVKRRLSSTDRDYQRLRNKLGLKNQVDVSSPLNQLNLDPPEGAAQGTVATRSDVGSLQINRTRGELLKNDLGDNIYEIITIPFSPLFVINYEIVFWTDYTEQMNQMIETLMNAYDGQGNQFRIDSEKGYWFVAFFEDDISARDNFEEFTGDERIVRYTFNVMATAYLVGQTHAGQQAPLRKFISAPQLSFEVADAGTQVLARRPCGDGTGDPGKFILEDVVPLDKCGDPQVGRNYGNVDALEVIVNPFTGDEERKYSRIRTRSQRGETVGSGIVAVKLDDIS